MCECSSPCHTLKKFSLSRLFSIGSQFKEQIKPSEPLNPSQYYCPKKKANSLVINFWWLVKKKKKGAFFIFQMFNWPSVIRHSSNLVILWQSFYIPSSFLSDLMAVDWWDYFSTRPTLLHKSNIEWESFFIDVIHVV